MYVYYQNRQYMHLKYANVLANKLLSFLAFVKIIAAPV